MISSQIKNFAKRISARIATRSNYKFILKDWNSLEDLGALSKVLETKRFSGNMEPVIMDAPRAKRILVIAPHPDDDVFSAGGTMLKLKLKKCSCRVVYLTSGSKDTYKDEARSVLAGAAEKIEAESAKASSLLGTEIEFWRYPSGRLKIDAESIERLKDEYRSFEPEAIFLPFIADDHKDHRQAVRLFYEAFRDLGKVRCEVWAYQIYSNILPNVVVDITDQMDEKSKLMGLWESKRLSRDWAHYIKGLNAVNSRFLKTNQPRYAEAFFVVPAGEYLELCATYFKELDRDK